LFAAADGHRFQEKSVSKTAPPLTIGEIWALSGDGIRVKGFVRGDGSYVLFEAMPGDGIPAGRQYKIWIANHSDYFGTHHRPISR